MKSLKKIDYQIFIKYLFIFFAFLLTEKLESQVFPYSVAVYSSVIFSGASIIFTPLLLISSLLVFGKTGLLLSTGIAIVVISTVKLLYKRFNSSPTYDGIFYTLTAMSSFLAFGDTLEFISFDKRLFVILLTTLLSFIFSQTLKVLQEKGIKNKYGYDELAVINASIIVLGIGICNLISPSIYKGFAVFSLLLVCYVSKIGVCTFISCVLSLPLVIYYGNLIYLSIFLLFSIVSQCFISKFRHFSSLFLIVCEYGVQTLFNVYGGFFLSNFIPVCIGAFLFSAIPTKPLKILKDKIDNFREKELTRQSINRNRVMLSNRLYELSNVFFEMSCAFSSFKKIGCTPEKAKQSIYKEIEKGVCNVCENKEKCNCEREKITQDIFKSLEIGFAKGKLSFIDLPTFLSENCVKPNNLLYLTNKLLAEYRTYSINFDNVNNGRDLISKEAEGVSQMLKGIAFDCGAILKYQSKIEREVGEALLKHGYIVNEILIYGENENTSISMILIEKEFSLTQLTNIISMAIKMPMILCEKNQVTEQKSYFLFKVRCKFDAVFGISFAVKEGKNKSGDTHSIERITENKFIVALSDGMGSGEKAENISSISLSLIESFYKAGLNSELILNTVNRLLAINEEDNFTALDLSIVDLKNGNVDFIKYGSPYGFVICEEGIKIVEGNTLPLGILSQLKPSVCSTKISDGDMIVLVTDGISDAFSSSSEIIDYLRTLPAKNPQTLCDSIIEKALSLNGGIKKDDMTALAVRIYQK